MFIPSYVIRSRHHVFYFRYPVGNQRLSISLKTRCPKQARHLARTLAQHSSVLLQNAYAEGKDDAQALPILRSCLAEKLGQPLIMDNEPISLPVLQVRTKQGYTLGKVIEAYLSEIKPSLTNRSYNEQRDCLKYLTDWLGEECSVTNLDDATARKAKALLRDTPNGRNKSKLTSGRPLAEQITIAREHGLPTLSTTSINKYLGYFGSLFGWAKRNRYMTDNPFTGMRVKAEKKKVRRREMFNKEEVAKITGNLANAELTKNKSNYWGAMLAVYTGARRNEIAALLPDDVKHDTATGIWYLDITDEEEQGKALKTEAAKRVVPIHSRLIANGFLEFVKESRALACSKSCADGYEPRLLYDLTYTEHEKWGRNLGRWFNESYLKALGLKSSKKTLHSLRHSLITHLGMAGVEVATIKSIVGHEPDTVTTETYTHYGVGHLPAFRDALEKLPY